MRRAHVQPPHPRAPQDQVLQQLPVPQRPAQLHRADRRPHGHGQGRLLHLRVRTACRGCVRTAARAPARPCAPLAWPCCMPTTRMRCACGMLHAGCCTGTRRASSMMRSGRTSSTRCAAWWAWPPRCPMPTRPSFTSRQVRARPACAAASPPSRAHTRARVSVAGGCPGLPPPVALGPECTAMPRHPALASAACSSQDATHTARCTRRGGAGQFGWQAHRVWPGACCSSSSQPASSQAAAPHAAAAAAAGRCWGCSQGAPPALGPRARRSRRGSTCWSRSTTRTWTMQAGPSRTSGACGPQRLSLVAHSCSLCLTGGAAPTPWPQHPPHNHPGRPL